MVRLMDLRLPGTNGTDALIAIRGEFPHARIIMLTTSDSDGEIQRAMRAGAAASMLKSMPKNDLLAVIRSVHSGRRQVPPTREAPRLRAKTLNHESPYELFSDYLTQRLYYWRDVKCRETARNSYLR